MKVTRIFGLALLGLLVSCNDTGSGPNGRTQVLLTDSPFPYDRVARVDMHIVRVQVAASADTSDPGSQGWTTIVEPNRTVNLIELQSGQTTLLGEASVDAGTVGAVRVVINTSLSSVTDNQGNPVTVHWPVQGELAIHAYVQSSLALFDAGTAHNLVIDFDVGRSFEDILEDGSLYFIPWIRALDDAGAGAITGTVRGQVQAAGPLVAIPNAAVTVLQGDPTMPAYTWWKVATGKTDALGRYRVAFLLLGSYIVRVEPLVHPTVGCFDTTNVQVGNAQTTTLNVDLPVAPGTCARRTTGGGGPDTTGTDTIIPPPTASVASVQLQVLPASPVVGDSGTAHAYLRDSTGALVSGATATFTVSDTSVVRVVGIWGNSLLFFPRTTGSVTITASYGSLADSKTITVR